MKKRPLFYLFCFAAITEGLVITSCDDDDNYTGAAPDEITAHYSNKLSITVLPKVYALLNQ